MFRLIGAELYKVWHNRIFRLFLGVLLGVNLFLLWFVTNPGNGADTKAAYEKMSEQLAGKTMEEKQAFLQEEMRQANGLLVVDKVLRGEAYNYGMSDAEARETFAAELEEFEDLYRSKQYLKYNNTLAKECVFLRKIAFECDTVYHYEKFLDDIAKKSKQLNGISLFADNANGYDKANIAATAHAYEDMRGTPIAYTPQMGIVTALDFYLTDFVFVLCILLLAMILIRTERDSGLLYYVRSMPAGRGRTAIAKMSAMAVSMIAILLLLYGTNFIYCNWIYGLGDLQRSVQSVPALMGSTFHGTVLQYIFAFLFTKWLTTLTIGMWVLFIMLAAKRAFTGVVGALGFLLVNLLVRSMVAATSHINVLKYANLVSLLRTNELLGNYRNLYWFGTPVNLVFVEGLTAAVSLVLFSLLFYRTLTYGNLQTARSKFLGLGRFTKVRRKAVTIQRIEWSKLLLINGALLFCALFLAYQLYQVKAMKHYLEVDEIYYKHYMEVLEGPLTQETITQVNALGEEFAPIREIEQKLRQGQISSKEYENGMRRYSYMMLKYEAWNNVVYKIRNLLASAEEYPRIQLVYESGYYQLFDLNHTRDQLDTLLANLVCVLCFAGFFALEKQTDMERVIGVTPMGQTDTVKKKLTCASWLCLFLAVGSVLPQFCSVMRDYGLGCFFAPIYSLSAFASMQELPIAFLLLWMLLARWCALRCAAAVTMALSYRVGKHFETMFLAATLFCLPSVLQIAGITAAGAWSGYGLFHIAAFATNAVEFWFVSLTMGIALALAYVCDVWLIDHFGVSTK